MKDRRGKLVGGSSALNFMAWNRASKAEYDSWNAFAPNKGWSWENLLPYFIRSESIASGQINVLPSLPPEEATAGNNAEEVGSDGPIKVMMLVVLLLFSLKFLKKVSYNDLYLDPVPVYVEALNSLDIRTNADPVSKCSLKLHFMPDDRRTMVPSEAFSTRVPTSTDKQVHVHTRRRATFARLLRMAICVS